MGTGLKLPIRKVIVLGALSLLIATISAPVNADTDKLAWIGGQYGMSVPNESGTTARTMFGITGGAKIGSEFGVGAYYLSSHNSETINGASQPWNYDLYGVMAGYFFEGEARGVYLGAMLGMTKLGAQYPQTSVGTTYSSSPMHWGLVAGYDYLIADHFSLGGEINYLAVSGGSATIGTTSFNSDAFSALDFLVSAKFWL